MTLLSLTRTAPTFRSDYMSPDSKSVRPELQNTHPMLVDCVSPLGPPSPHMISPIIFIIA